MDTSRRGFGLLESVVSMALMAGLLALTLKMFAATAEQRRAAERRSIAQIEAANIAEHVATLPWTEITSQRLSQIGLSLAARQWLPHGELNVEVEDTADRPKGKRVRLEIAWTNGAGQREAPLRLTAWAHTPLQDSKP